MESGPVPPPPPPAAPSFAEVLRLIQNGQEPPGLRHPRASPTGDSPTASRLPPPTKPWENRTASAGPRICFMLFYDLFIFAQLQPALGA
ncbi:uncharacterized protein C6orf226 homolog isoform X2 [Aquila chrysaetos chrysaetos]|uniref:uncharacterized protein C6orf226 homolog isoform X2 n=1 Tax=Aquila chrysaetos chrysaetos TaxID=223781 RepID=UPI0011765EFB|nr:uncharacterized protein C6orf226 homolog isoform X2 [Aquila chrysaetos chrysaetos]